MGNGRAVCQLFDNRVSERISRIHGKNLAFDISGALKGNAKSFRYSNLHFACAGGSIQSYPTVCIVLLERQSCRFRLTDQVIVPGVNKTQAHAVTAPAGSYKGIVTFVFIVERIFVVCIACGHMGHDIIKILSELIIVILIFFSALKIQNIKEQVVIFGCRIHTDTVRSVAQDHFPLFG